MYLDSDYGSTLNNFEESVQKAMSPGHFATHRNA